MFAAVVRDAWRQYRRRPLAAVLTVVVGGLPVFLDPDDPVLAIPLAIFLLGAGLLVELFLVAWLAGALDPAPTSAQAALAVMRRTIAPGVRAGLLRAAYLLLALMVGLLLFGSRDSEPLPTSEQTKLAIGLWPLFGVAFAFLAVLMQRVVLGGERRVRQAAGVSHRVASAYFPICLVIGLLQASGLVVASLVAEFWMLAVLSIALALADPYLIGLCNALYLRTRADQEPVDAGDGSLRPPHR
ncbi:MAG TPA: hypothetical protein VHK02_00790 [Actinomycetota bacterium]|jgi:hypothetical protein|nr:hypothetical protein [Actinomycetota bacterium]